MGLMHFSAVVVGQHQSLDGFHMVRTASLRIESDQTVPVQLDGDAGGFLACGDRGHSAAREVLGGAFVSPPHRRSTTRRRVTPHQVAIGEHQCGPDQALLLIAGPCVLESEELALTIAGQLKAICQELPLQLVFKASFDKANRTSVESYRGVGLDRGLEILQRVRQDTGIPVTTDIHEPSQAAAVGQVCDLLQIPAFLARQTDLLAAAARTGRPVHVKRASSWHPATCVM